MIFISLGISIIYFGCALRIAESPLTRENAPQYGGLHSYWNCFWNIIITMTTVGYGDYFPLTHVGRTIMVFVCIWGVSSCSIMVVTLTNTLNCSSLENRAITVLDRLFLKESVKQAAAAILISIAKTAKIVKNTILTLT